MKPTLVADEMFPEGAGPYVELEEVMSYTSEGERLGEVRRGSIDINNGTFLRYVAFILAAMQPQSPRVRVIER